MIRGRGFRVAKVFGIDIRLDQSWFIISFFIAWSFGGLFKQALRGLEPSAYTVLGVLAAILFFLSLLAHEMSHALVARRKGIEVISITLFIFGGVAQIKSDPVTPGDEFQVAAVGPLTSVVIGAVLFGLGVLADAVGSNTAAVVFETLGFVNGALAVFNMIPGFPLDGGRILRSVVWKITGNVLKATKVASISGRVMAGLLIGAGIWRMVRGDILGGGWWILLGLFLNQAAASAYKQAVMRMSIEGVSVGSLMTPQPESVPGNARLDQVVEEFFVAKKHNAFPVTGYGGDLEGIITLQMVQEIPQQMWPQMTARQSMVPLQPDITAQPDESVANIVERMSNNPVGRFLVVEGQRLVGILTASDIARHYRLQTSGTK
ncbi:MAG: site-2 protease family protein [Actinomycetota bacterium]